MDEENNIVETVPIKYNKNNYVIEANELVRSRQDELSLLEAKLIRLAISQILKKDTELLTYTCQITDLVDFLGISSHTIYNDVKELSINIMKKSIFIKDKQTTKNGKENYKIFHWMDSIEYKDGTITFKLSNSLKPYLIGLDQLFTSYTYEEILRLPTNYSIRLYELLYSYANMRFRQDCEKITYNEFMLEKDEVCFSLEWLRDYFNCKDKYKNNVDFIKRVITSSIEDINKFTVFPCEYRLIREKNKIKYIIFKTGIWNSEAGHKRLKELEDEVMSKLKGKR